MHRFFVPPDSIDGDVLVLPNAQARQIREVLHLRAGETIVALDNLGNAYRVELAHVAREAVRGRVVEKIVESREPRTQLILYQSLLKADRFEWVLQKCTEFGIAEFVPVITTRTVAGKVSHAKRARWERILTEATEQSDRNKIPLLHDVCTLAEALSSARTRGGLILMPWEEERATDLHSALRAEQTIHLFIGPEGGLAAQEVELARTHGAVPITLGPRILRAETAGLVAASAIFFAQGEMDIKQDSH